MKTKLSCILLALIFTFSLSACGSAAESSQEPASDTAASQASEPAAAPDTEASVEEAEPDGSAADYIVPASWTEISLNDGTWGYTVSEAETELLTGYSQDDAGNYYMIEDPLTLIRCTGTGDTICSITAPSLVTDPDAVMTTEYLNYVSFTDDGVWLV